MRLTPPQGADRKECTAQVFWSTVERQMCEDTSAMFPAQLDGKWHEYVVDLAAKPAWKDVADQLRLDPCDAADVGIEVDRIELQ
jgi:hypothetical protein